jgi:hypothetical protein
MNILFSIYWWFVKKYYEIYTRKYIGKTYLDTWDLERFTITGQYVERSNRHNVCILNYTIEDGSLTCDSMSLDYLELFSKPTLVSPSRYKDLGYIITKEEKPKSHMPAWF